MSSYCRFSRLLSDPADLGTRVGKIMRLPVSMAVFLARYSSGRKITFSVSRLSTTFAAFPEVHEQFNVEDIKTVRRQFPDVVVLAHPECSPEVVQESDFSGSTSPMVRYVEKTTAPRYLLLTECSMGDNIAASNPKKELLRLCSIRCPHMGEITLEDTLAALEKNQYVVDVDEEIRNKSLQAVERMISIG